MSNEKKPLGDVLEFLRGKPEDFDLQAGTRGMVLTDVVSTYLKSPGQVLAILRLFERQTQGEVAEATRVPVEKLNAYEKGEIAPSLEHLAALAGHYKADLRSLLEIFGHVAEGASETSMGLAAQFSGELTESEKLDLKALFKEVSGKGSK